MSRESFAFEDSQYATKRQEVNGKHDNNVIPVAQEMHVSRHRHRAGDVIHLQC
jgi:hypothetical protein